MVDAYIGNAAELYAEIDGVVHKLSSDLSDWEKTSEPQTARLPGTNQKFVRNQFLDKVAHSVSVNGIVKNDSPHDLHDADNVTGVKLLGINGQGTSLNPPRARHGDRLWYMGNLQSEAAITVPADGLANLRGGFVADETALQYGWLGFPQTDRHGPQASSASGFWRGNIPADTTLRLLVWGEITGGGNIEVSLNLTSVTTHRTVDFTTTDDGFVRMTQTLSTGSAQRAIRLTIAQPTPGDHNIGCAVLIG